MNDRCFFKPEDAVCADFIPFYENGTFYLFYLKDYRNKETHGEGTPWFLTTTQDFVHFQDHGEILPRGAVSDQDLYVFTGSVITWGGRYHIYYTGHNPHLRAAGLPEQAVMHAVSQDLLHWTKCPEDTFFAPAHGYDMHDWRDPFVFWREDKQRLDMLLAARGTQGPSRRRGLTAVCHSTDGTHWTVGEPFWSPGLYFTHECPDLFQMGGWHYMIYSEFSERVVTRYRMSRSLEGPWLAPPDDQFDGRAFYAAKSCAGNGGRFLFGWIPTRENELATGGWQWGGCLCVHELVQRPDGTLSTRMPMALESSFEHASTIPSQSVDASRGFAVASLGNLPDQCLLTAELTPAETATNFGLCLCGDPAIENGIFLRIEPAHGRVVMDRWPRPGDLPFDPGLERPLPPKNQEGGYTLQLLLDKTAGTAYLQGQIALSFRMYEPGGTHWGIFAQDGQVAFSASYGMRSCK